MMKFHSILIAAFLSFSIFSCKDTEQKTTETVVPADTRATIEYNENRLDSVPENNPISRHFKGGGGEPFWSVEIIDKKVKFQSPDDKNKSLSATVSTVDASGNTITINSENDSETIKVALLEQECINGMNGKTFTHKVELSIQGNEEKDPRTYSGCGSFIKN